MKVPRCFKPMFNNLQSQIDTNKPVAGFGTSLTQVKKVGTAIHTAQAITATCNGDGTITITVE